MKTPSGFGFAYHVVATAFGILLIFFVISVLSFLFGGTGTAADQATDTEINVNIKSKPPLNRYNPATDEPDSLQKQATDFNASLILPLRDFKKSDKILYWLLIIRWLVIWICWLIFLYQLFLIFYDCKKGLYFSGAQIKRMDNATLAMLFLMILHFLSIRYTGYFSSGGLLVIHDSCVFSISPTFLLYLIFAAVLRGFTAYIKAGCQNNRQTN